MENVLPPYRINTEDVNIDINQVHEDGNEETKIKDVQDEYDTLAVKVLKEEFRNDPEMFILNRLLTCYMFFENYTEDIKVLHKETSPIDQQLNSTIIEGHKKQYFMPDSILENINKRVKFEHSSGPKKGIIEPLATQRLIVMHDNIEVIETIPYDYETIDKPCYQATTENSNYKGFLRLNISESENLGYSKRQSKDSAYSAPSFTHNKRKSIIHPYMPNEEFSEIARNDSGVSTAANSDPEYEYSRIPAAQTPQDMVITEMDANTNTFQLPASCIVKFKKKNKNLVYEDDEEDDENVENNLYIYKYYLNSSEFMKHFKNTVFPNYIGELLGFSKNSIQIVKSIPGAVFCNRKDYNNPFWEHSESTDSMVEFEVIPAIFFPWPHSIIDWTFDNRIEGSSRSWPTEKMITKCRSFHAVIVPKGCVPNKLENSQMHLEWEIRYPQIERYLEFRMSYAQLRVFLYLIVLFKKFIEPITQMHGLSIEHLRFLIFWQCEQNYDDWFEDRLGNKTMAVLKKLYEYLGKCEMPHYFIKRRNIFENVPRKYLISNQEIIHDILESPVSYFFCALKDLRYSEKFYPRPNIEELEDILKAKDFEELNDIIKSKNGLNIGIPMSKRQKAIQKARENIKKNKAPTRQLDSDQLWNKKFDEMKRINAQIQQEAEEKDRKNLAFERPILSLDVNTNFRKKLCSKSMETTVRQFLILQYFIKHFIEIAQTSLKISTTEQTMFYLKQAFYLTELLEDIESEIENARNFKTQIKLEVENCEKIRRKLKAENTERTDKRFGFQYDVLQVKGMDINMSNLNTTYEGLKEAKTKYVVVGDENDATTAESQRNADANSNASSLENRDAENIEVIADVYYEPVMENQRNGDFINQDDETNSIFNDFENIFEVENRRKDDDKIEFNHLRSISERTDVNNHRDDDPMKYFLNRIRNNSSMVIFGNQNEDAIDTTNDLEKFEVDDDEVDAERHIIPGYVTYPPIKSNRNDEERNSENHMKDKSKEIKFNDENEVTDHLKKTTFENDDQKNDDNSTIANKKKQFFRIGTYEERSKV